MTSDIVLREIRDADLVHFFDWQRDPEAIRMAAFTARDPSDHEAFLAHWARVRGSDKIVARTIEHAGQVVGSVLRFELFGKPEVSYWIDRAWWGRGLATAALARFLAELGERPLHARAASDNVASLRVLAKCGFTICGTERAFANGRGQEIEETLLVLL